jgi:hypothetical protein
MTDRLPPTVDMGTSMIQDALRHSLERSLATTDFDPEYLELADVFLGYELGPTVADGTPAMISAGLNSVDLSYVYLNIDRPGRRLVAGVWKDPDLTNSVWLDLRPAEALELGRRLLICAEAAARFAEAFPEEPDDGDGDGDTAVDP